MSKLFAKLECFIKGHRWKTMMSDDTTDRYYYRECEICGKTEIIGFH